MMQRSTQQRGFTLVELVVAVAVLALLIVIMGTIIEAASRTMRLSNRMIDASSQARLVFGCMSNDLSNLIKRPDVPFSAQNAAVGNNNLLCFFSQVASADTSGGTGSNRGISVVAYQVAASSSNLGPDGAARPCLIRAGKPVFWGSSGYFGLDSTGLPISFSTSTFPSSLVPQAADFDVLAQGVLAMVVGFQLYPDNQAATLQDGTAIANAIGQVVYSPPMRSVTPYGGGTAISVIDLTRISSIVVGLVVIDQTNLRQLTSAQITALESKFVLPANDTLPVPAWGATADAPNTFPATVPLPARQSLRVFQSFFPVTPFTSHP